MHPSSMEPPAKKAKKIMTESPVHVLPPPPPPQSTINVVTPPKRKRPATNTTNTNATNATTTTTSVTATTPATPSNNTTRTPPSSFSSSSAGAKVATTNANYVFQPATEAEIKMFRRDRISFNFQYPDGLVFAKVIESFKEICESVFISAQKNGLHLRAVENKTFKDVTAESVFLADKVDKYWVCCDRIEYAVSLKTLAALVKKLCKNDVIQLRTKASENHIDFDILKKSNCNAVTNDVIQILDAGEIFKDPEFTTLPCRPVARCLLNGPEWLKYIKNYKETSELIRFTIFPAETFGPDDPLADDPSTLLRRVPKLALRFYQEGVSNVVGKMMVPINAGPQDIVYSLDLLDTRSNMIFQNVDDSNLWKYSLRSLRDVLKLTSTFPRVHFEFFSVECDGTEKMGLGLCYESDMGVTVRYTIQPAHEHYSYI